MFLFLLVEIVGLLFTLLLVVRAIGLLFSPKLRSHIADHPIRHIFWFVLVIFFFFGSFGRPLGYLAAKIDLNRRHYELQSSGISAPPKIRIVCSRLLRERYGIVCPPIAGCIVSHNEIAFQKAYDSVARPAIIAFFGHDVFAECEHDARVELNVKKE
jgi:hypothetical protein